MRGLLRSSWLLALSLLSAACGQRSGTQESSEPIVNVSVSAPEIDIAIPVFNLTDQNGKPFGQKDMLGSVFVVDFIFTSCPNVCPELTKRMASLSKELRDKQGLKFLSITVDPETDTPEKLRAFRDKYGDAEAPWFFITGEPKVVDETVLQGFKMAMTRGTNGGHGDASIFHAERFVVIDKQAHLRGIYATTPDGMTALKQKVNQLLAE